MSSSLLTSLFNETDFIQYLIADLWRHFNANSSLDEQMNASNTLSKLHSILPDHRCDQLICHQFSFETYPFDEYKRFFQFWHFNQNYDKAFEQCLLTVLYPSKHHYLKSLVQQWICQCYTHGDINRIFRILFHHLHQCKRSQTNLQRLNEHIQEEFFSIDINVPNTFDEDYDDEYMRDYQMEHEEDNQITLSESNKSTNQFIKFPSFLSSFSSPNLSKSPKNRTGTMTTDSSRKSTQFTSIDTRTHSLTMDNPSGELDLSPLDYCSTKLHFHLLIYTESIDFPRIISILDIIDSLINILSSQLIHRLFISTDIPSSLNEEFTPIHRDNSHQSYLFILFDILLRFIRSYPLKDSEMIDNREVQLRSYSLLTRLCQELSSLAINQTIPIDDVNHLLRKVSFQKVIVHLFQGILPKKSSGTMREIPMEEFLRLVSEMIFLEHLIYSTDSDRFYQSLVNQTMFLSLILQYLKDLHLMTNHHFILDFIIQILPYSGSTLKSISVAVIEQLYRNLYYLAQPVHQHHFK